MTTTIDRPESVAKHGRLDRLRPLVVFVVCGMAVTLAGCSEATGPNRHRVSGTIHIGSQTITGGFVVIEPAHGSPAGPLQGYAPIRDGHFDTDDGGQRAASGPAVLRINGWGAPTEQFKNGAPLCNRYELKIDLKAEANTLDLVVPESARLKEPRGGWGELP